MAWFFFFFVGFLFFFLLFCLFLIFFLSFFSCCKHLKDRPSCSWAGGSSGPAPGVGQSPRLTLPGPGWRSPKGRQERGEISRLVSAKKPSRAPGRVRVGGGGAAGEKRCVLRLAGCPPAAFPFVSGRRAKHHGRVWAEGVPGGQSSPGDQRLRRGEQVASLFSHCLLLDVSGF